MKAVTLKVSKHLISAATTLLLGVGALAVSNAYAADNDSFPHAVCDTDTNCVYYDEYKQYGVTGVYFSHDDENDMRWVEVYCENTDKTFIIDDPSEMEVVCKEN